MVIVRSLADTTTTDAKIASDEIIQSILAIAITSISYTICTILVYLIAMMLVW